MRIRQDVVIATRKPTWCTCSGGGLDAERYVIERYRSLGQTERSARSEAEAAEARRRAGASPAADHRRASGAVKKMRPERDEIIVCTALDLKASGRAALGRVCASGILAAPPRALSEVPGHGRPGSREGERQRSPSPAPRRPRRRRRVHQMWKVATRARPQAVRELRREAPRRRQGPPRQSPGQALRRARSGQVPPRQLRRRQATPPGAARSGAVHGLRPQPARGEPYRLRDLPRGAAGSRTRSLRGAQGCRCLRALRRAGCRRHVPLRPTRRAGGGTGLARAKERRQEEAIRPAARPRRLRGLRCPLSQRRALSRLRGAFQHPRPRLARRAAGAAVLHRDGAGDGDRPRHL